MHVEMRGSSAWTIYGCLTRRGEEGRGAETDKKETWKPQQSTTPYLVHAVRVVAATPGLEVPVKLPLTRVTGH